MSGIPFLSARFSALKMHVTAWLHSKTMWLGAFIACDGLLEILNTVQQNVDFFGQLVPAWVMGFVHIGLALAVWWIRYKTTKPLLDHARPGLH